MDYLILSITLLGIGLYGLLSKRNLMKVLIAIELMAIAASINFILLSTSVNETLGEVFLILTFATDSSITGIILAVLIIIAKKYGTWDLKKLGELMRSEPTNVEKIIEEAGEEEDSEVEGFQEGSDN
jgi:NADH:ubiquinone oxidoreductase subunit K